MFFTRTIRRKMASGLALVLVMLAVLAASAISALASLDEVLADLKFSLERVPHWSDLSGAIAQVGKPLLVDPQDPTASISKTEVAKALEVARGHVTLFYGKLQKLSSQPKYATWSMTSRELLPAVDAHLSSISEVLLRTDGDVLSRDDVRHVQTAIMRAQSLASGPEEYAGGWDRSLRDAGKAHDRGRTRVIIGTAVVAVLLGLLIAYGYHYVFKPLRKLHQGAVRVAHGDFNYRLKVRGGDEMAELAEAFNEMTNRFQEITCDLDRQVRERSKQLLRSERLAGIGFLAAGVAHEINNPLSAIAMAAESLCGKAHCEESTDSQRNDVDRQYLEMIQREAFRCQQITQKLLNFARGDNSARSRNDLTELIREVIAMVRPMNKYAERNIDFVRTEPCYAEVNGPEVKQVVLNITSNALESMWPGGTLHIDFEEQTDDVVMTFRDDGCGMTAEDLEHLFEPFYTNRQDGKGTGLGMSISHRIVADHGGSIEAQSEGPGCGSTFRVRLPRRPKIRRMAA